MSQPLTLTIPVDVLAGLREQVKAEVLAELRAEIRTNGRGRSDSPYMTIPEAAAFLRCSRQRVDDLLSQQRLSRFKDGSRTLVSRVEVEEHLRHEKRRA